MEDCGFGGEQVPLDIMMRDHFVCGIRNEAVKQRLLAEHNLTLEVAYDMTVTAEATAKQQRDMRKQGRDESKDGEGVIQATCTKQGITAEDVSCYRCNGKHAPHLCKFRKAVCFKCRKVGHVGNACRTKDINKRGQKTTPKQQKGKERLRNERIVFHKQSSRTRTEAHGNIADSTAESQTGSRLRSLLHDCEQRYISAH